MYGGNFSTSVTGNYEFSGITAGLGSALTGGDFLQGAGIGLMTTGLNHLQHTIQDEIARLAEHYRNNANKFKSSWDVNSSPEKMQKCNRFVFDVTDEAGAGVGHYFSAGEWADTSATIPGWEVVNGAPQRGDVAAFSFNYPDGASGHCGIIVRPSGKYLIYAGIHDIRMTSISNFFVWNNLKWTYRRYIGK